MEFWIVVEYERVEVTQLGSHEPQYVAGDIARAHVIKAKGEAQAILMAAEAYGPGFYTAQGVTRQIPSEAKLVVD